MTRSGRENRSSHDGSDGVPRRPDALVTPAARLLREVQLVHKHLDRALLRSVVMPGSDAHSETNPVAVYAHAVCLEDALISVVMRAKPLFAGLWSDKIYWSPPTRLSTKHSGRELGPRFTEAARLRRYGAEVHSRTYAYLRQLKRSNLSRTIDVPSGGLAQSTLDAVLRTCLIDRVSQSLVEIERVAATAEAAQPTQLTYADGFMRGVEMTLRAVERSLNAPVSVALGYAELLAADSRITPQLRPLAANMLDGVGSIGRSFEELRDRDNWEWLAELLLRDHGDERLNLAQ